MPRRQLIFEKNQPYHIISRAVEEREIFKKEENCYRFIFQIFAASVGKPAFNLWRRDVIKIAKSLLLGEDISSRFIIKEHPPLVHILDFSLVINHYHFYLVPNHKEGVPLFMKKLNGGFAKYFNLKYKRRGSLFGSRYKGILVETDFQSDAVSRYIAVINPLDIYQPGWRRDGLKNLPEAFSFLENYRFSSFSDKIGKRISKIIAPRDILERYCVHYDLTKNDYSQFVKDFLKERLSRFQDLFYE